MPTTLVKLIKTLKQQFSHFEIPKIIVTDGGPQFTSVYFTMFYVLYKLFKEKGMLINCNMSNHIV